MDLKLLIGRMVGDYQIKKLLGAGGMGAVFLGWHQHMKLPFAVKVLRPEHAQNQGFLDRFFQEAHLGAQLRHENAVSIHNAGIADLTTATGSPLNLPFLAMEFVQGQSVRSAQKQADGERFADSVATEIILQALRALNAAHALGLIHRDIKPDNLMIARTGVVKITDFGLARNIGGSTGMTVTGQILGTPLYMSMEQWQGLDDIDGRTDIYSLGATFYQLLAGQPPFDGNEPVAVLHRLLATDAPALAELAPQTNADLIPIVMRMMAKKRDDRFTTAADAIRALEAWQRRHQSDCSAVTTLLTTIGLRAVDLPEISREPTTENRSKLRSSNVRTPPSQSAGRTRAVQVGGHVIDEAQPPTPPQPAPRNLPPEPELLATVPGKRVPPSVRRAAKTAASPVPQSTRKSNAGWVAAIIAVVMIAALVASFAVTTNGPKSNFDDSPITEDRSPTRNEHSPANPDSNSIGTINAGSAANTATTPPANSDPASNPTTNAGNTANGSANANSSPVPLADEAAFDAARTTDSADAYRRFVREFPQSIFVAAANRRLAELDDAAFTAAERTGTAAAFRAYLTAFPSGNHAAEAADHVAWFDACRAAATAPVADWPAVCAPFAAYERAFPRGLHLAAIDAELARLDRPHADTLAGPTASVANRLAYLDAVAHAPSGRVRRRPYANEMRRCVEPQLYAAIGNAITAASVDQIVAACERYLSYVPDGPAAIEASLRRKHPLPSASPPARLPGMAALKQMENGFWKGSMVWNDRNVTMDFVFVPAGIVCISPPGTPPAERQWAEYAGFWLSIDEVSAGDWNTFERSRDPRVSPLSSRDRVLPVCGVRAPDAGAFCEWLGGRLPTETELLAAMRGFADAIPRRYSWPDSDGNAPAKNHAVWAGDAPMPNPADTLDIGPFGHRHLAGNVREWCRMPSLANDSLGVWGGSFAVDGGSRDWAATFRATPAATVADRRDIGLRVCLSPAGN